MGELPPGVVARIDQGEAADAEILDALLVTYRQQLVLTSHTQALVSLTVAALATIAGGAGDRVAGALAVAVARLCNQEQS